MKKHYIPLALEQRYQIWALLNSGRTQSEIARELGVDRSTISRELKRNQGDKGYDPKQAEKLSQQRRRHARKAGKRTAELEQQVVDGLRRGWSPGSISERLKLEKDDKNQQVSHTTIYQWIAHNEAKGGCWHHYLPNQGRTRWKSGKRSRKAGASLIPDRRDISERPVGVDSRQEMGHWEGDTVHGQSAHLVTLVERKSLFTLAKRVFNKTKEVVGDAMIHLLESVGKALCCSMTLDNGGEFADHVRVGKALEMDVFFARPYASWQRGTNENTNGRIRRFWPKKFDMGTLTDEEVERRIWHLNMTPRKKLGGLTPFEAFTGQRVALIS